MAHRLRSQLHERFAGVLSSADGDAEVIAHQLERAHAERSVMGAADRRPLRWRFAPARHSTRSADARWRGRSGSTRAIYWSELGLLADEPGPKSAYWST